ncbi:MAG: hypothetical protein MH252_18255 [Thermosynechococcaceae cyanobacterium MS004]|nr:hypothetical protein [Thermosynechococcaceae cyanobacterium MS004]
MQRTPNHRPHHYAVEPIVCAAVHPTETQAGQELRQQNLLIAALGFSALLWLLTSLS